MVFGPSEHCFKKYTTIPFKMNNVGVQYTILLLFLLYVWYTGLNMYNDMKMVCTGINDH